MSPSLSVVRGRPTPEELAAVVALVVAASAPVEAPAPAPARSLWTVPVLRGPVVPGPGAWRASGLPR